MEIDEQTTYFSTEIRAVNQLQINKLMAQREKLILDGDKVKFEIMKKVVAINEKVAKLRKGKLISKKRFKRKANTR